MFRRIASFISLLLAVPLFAAEPEVRTLDVRGLAVGGTTTLILDGDSLGTAPKLLLPFPAKVALQPKNTNTRAVFEVTLAADVPPGYYNLRAVTDGGVSLPVLIGVDRLPQRLLTPTTDALPVSLHGSVGGGATVETTFPGKAGQRVMIEVEAQRLGSKLRPVVHLIGPNKLQLAWSWPTPTLASDTRLEATLPAEGTYTVAVHDAEYAPPAPSFFRLKVGQWNAVDQVFPPVIGNDAKQVEFLTTGTPLKVDLPTARGSAPWLPLAWPKDGNWSGPRPFVELSSRPEIVEPVTPTGKPIELPGVPCGASGRLFTPLEDDRYRVPVTPGQKLLIEVFAEQIGSPVDVALVVRNDAGAELARTEDSPKTLDPSLPFIVPANVSAIGISVLDSQGRGGPRAVYRLTVSPAPPDLSGSDFDLETPARRVGILAGGVSVVPVIVQRRGYSGRIDVTADGLPASVKLENTTIPPDADGSLVVVKSGDVNAPAAVTGWKGRSDDNRERLVFLRGHPLERLQPWLATELAVTPTSAKATDFGIDWKGLPADTGLVPAKKFSLPVAIKRTDANTVVRLSLLTSQLPRLVNNQPDPNSTIRVERAVELGAKLTEGEQPVLVPADLPSPMYDVAVQAEFLTPDKKTVLATAFTPVRRMTVRLPITVKLDGSPKLTAKRDPKTGVTTEVLGSVVRSEGFTGDVPLSLTGLPAGATAPAVTVKAGETKFTMKLTFPATVAAGDVTGLKLSATVVPDTKTPNVRVRSRDVDLTVTIPPAPAK